MAMKAKTKVKGKRHDPLDKQVLNDRHPEHKKEEKPSKGDKRAKKRETQSEYISEDLSKKILSQAREQLDDDSDSDGIPDEAPSLPPKPLSRLGADSDDEEEPLSEDEAHYIGDVELNPDDERAMAMFMTAEDGPKRTLADAVMEKLRAVEGGFTGGKDEVEEAVARTMNPKVVQVYRGCGSLSILEQMDSCRSVGEFLKSYTVGKMPKAFKIVPVLSNWEEILFLTKPEEWSPSASYQATRLFASNLNQRMAQRFYSLILLPRVRENIAANRRLHFWLYQALKKALYKSAAFYKGILLPLCEEGDCTLREAVIIGSVLTKVSIPLLQSSAALLKLAEMPYSGANSVFIRVLLDKKYALPHRVLGGVVNHFLLFANDQRALPVLWHQSLLTLCQRYKNDLSQEQKDAIRALVRIKAHHVITEEIRRELAAAAPNVVPMQA